VFETAALSEPQTVLVVDDDAATLDRVRSAMTDRNGNQLRTESTIADGADRLEGVDAVVSDTALSDERGTDLLRHVRKRYPTLPFVFYTSESPTDIAETVSDDEWVTVVEKNDSGATVRLLDDAVTRLVDSHRSATLAGRALAAIETARDGIALVGPDDRFQFVNQAFASQFGYEPDDLYGRDWRVCYPSEEVDRLERTALESVAEGWLWTGGCRGVDADGAEVTARTRITGLDDDSLVFVLCETPRQE
jgi:PAS domain S-box-containing protein